MTLNTTPLQLGYFFSLVLWILLLSRGFKQQRLSDKMLGWIMLILAIELQDYTFGFAGINILWEQFNGFPRDVSLLLGPTMYLYFRSQVNRMFKFEKIHIWHFMPYFVYFLYCIVFFVQGPEAVVRQQDSVTELILGYVYHIFLVVSYIFYSIKCLSIYRAYRVWSLQQFSNLEIISFKWFRNFVYSMILWLVFREFMGVLDSYLNLSFYEDWWWNLALAAVAFYIGLIGYSQIQPSKINFDQSNRSNNKKNENQEFNENSIESKKSEIALKLKEAMEQERLYLQPDLNLHELAQHIQTNAVELSATINQVFKQNFNDYINNLRIEAFIELFQNEAYKSYTMLSIAYDSGFNSKATFNRSFKKIKGMSPKEYFEKR
ncbi:MAG: helix-turn-helix domain-containing protein [Crocinitomicaceae bacterium]